MEFQDRILRCVDCATEFVWTAGEQQFFADKNFKNEPKRCKACKSKRGSRPRAGRNPDDVLGLRQGNDGAFQADAGASRVLQRVLPVPEIRRGWGRLALPAPLRSTEQSPRTAIVVWRVVVTVSVLRQFA